MKIWKLHPFLVQFHIQLMFSPCRWNKANPTSHPPSEDSKAAARSCWWVFASCRAGALHNSCCDSCREQLGLTCAKCARTLAHNWVNQSTHKAPAGRHSIQEQLEPARDVCGRRGLHREDRADRHQLGQVGVEREWCWGRGAEGENCKTCEEIKVTTARLQVS